MKAKLILFVSVIFLGINYFSIAQNSLITPASQKQIKQLTIKKIVKTKKIKCFAECDAEAKVIAIWGASNPNTYAYLWSNGQTDKTATGLCAGTYSVTVTDGIGNTATSSVTITEPPLLEASIIGTDVQYYGGSDGSADLTVTGGTPPYIYLWSNGLTVEDISGLSAGTYCVTVTDDKSCSVVECVTIKEYHPLTQLQAGDCGATDVDLDQILKADSVPGATQYEFLVENDSLGFSQSAIKPNRNFILLDLPDTVKFNTTYNVSVRTVIGTDTSDYGTVCQIKVKQALHIYWLTLEDYYLCPGELFEVNCTVHNGYDEFPATFCVQISDASGNFDACPPLPISQILGCITLDALPTSPSDPFDLSIDAIIPAGIQPGTYLIRIITDDCIISWWENAVIEIIIIPAPTISAITLNNASCNGYCDGSASVFVGVDSYTYLWSNGQTSVEASNLCAGTYTVTVTGANGCTATSSVTITEPPLLTANITGTNVLCFGDNNGIAVLTVSGGTLPYTYLWSTGQITEDISNFYAGTYCVTVTDDNGCTATECVDIYEPPLLTANIYGIDVLCNGENSGSAYLDVSGGTPSYTYLWNTGQTTYDLNDIYAGIYCVTVTDVNLCSATECVTITEPSEPLIVNITGTDVLCNGDCYGTANLTVTGGTSPYTYLWSTGQTEQNIKNLCAGDYTVTVTDANGCTATSSVTITEPSLLLTSIGVSIININECHGDCNAEAIVGVSGGTPPYTYLWNDQLSQTSPTATELCAGDYTVTVTDANDCIATNSVTITEPQALFALIKIPFLKCYGDCDATLMIGVSGGTPPYTYEWSNGQTTPTVTDICAGFYSVVITDANGCTLTKFIIIQEPPQLIIDFTNIISETFNCNGEATANVTSGIPSYSYLWDSNAGNQTTPTATGLCAGTYTVTVTDANGCTITGMVNILLEPACVDVDCDINLDNDNALELFNQNGSSYDVFNKIICINNTFTVDKNVSFNDGCTVVMGNNAEIVIQTGSTNTLEIHNTHILSCDEMWNRIYIPDETATLIIDDFSIIQDAVNAVLSENCGVFIINNSTFQFNFRNLVIRDCWNPLGTVENTTFIGINLALSISGIEMHNVHYFIVGDNNSFTSLRYGIYTINSDYIVNNNTFNNHRIAIYSDGGEEAGIFNSTITNSTMGISMHNIDRHILIENVIFDNIDNDGMCISNSNDITIINNELSNIGGTAIIVQEIIPFNSFNLYIFNNIINQSLKGIYVTNYSGAIILDNNISLTPLTTEPVFSQRPAGIKLEGCQKTIIEHNTIIGNNPWLWWTSGIWSLNSQNNFILKNIIDDIGRVFSFGGSAFPNYLTCNDIGRTLVGVYLEWCGTGIGEQGGPDCADLSDNRWTNTTWADWEAHTTSDWSLGSNSTFHVRGDLGPEYIPDVNDNVPDPPQIPDFVPIPPPVIINGCGLVDNCSSKSNKSTSNGYENERMIANNEIAYGVYPEENEWLSKNYVYYRTKQDSAMLNYDTIFVNFRDSMAYTVTGTLYEINNLFSDTIGNIDTALIIMLNNSIIPGNIIEENYKTVNDIYINTIAIGIDSLTPSQINELISIAEQCPYTGGNAVFSAGVILSALLDTNIYYNCDIINFKNYQTTNIEKKENNVLIGKIYPNPNSGQLFLEYDLPEGKTGKLIIYNTLGDKICSYSLQSELKTLIINKDLSNGIYFYKIVVDDKVIINKKLIIIR